MVDTPISDNEARQAVHVLAGYAYQLYQTLFAWLNLTASEVLFVEVAEDYAVAATGKLDAAQIRAIAANITLGSQYALKAINAFWDLKHKNHRMRVTYRYLTTSAIGHEQGMEFPDGRAGLDYWRRAATPGIDVKPLRDALLSLDLGADLKRFVETSSDDDFRQELLQRIHWYCGEANLTELKKDIEMHVAWRAQRSAQAPAAQGRALVEPLIGRLLNIASTKLDAARRLTSLDLDEFIQTREGVLIPRQAVSQFFGGLLDPSLGTLGFSDGGFLTPADSIPLPEPLLERTSLVGDLAHRASLGGILFLRGSSGMGKSTMARLFARKLGQTWTVLDFRELEPDGCNNRLRFVAARTDGSSYILDDLPVEQDSRIEQMLAILARTLRSQDRLLLITCNSRPSARLLSLLGSSGDMVADVPCLSPQEVAALVEQEGGDGAFWGAITHTVCGGGHPQLVMARIRRLARLGWPRSEIWGGFDPKAAAPEIEDERSAVRKRLFYEMDDRAKTLIDRLSVIGNRFDRPLALALGASPPQIPNAGDTLTQLTGPWVEPLGHGYLRLSPLLSGTAENNLTPEQIASIRTEIVNNIMGRNPIPGSLIGVALFHALTSLHEAALFKLATLLITLERDKKKFAAEELFALEFLTTDRLAIPNKPHLSIILRLAQFHVCVQRQSWDGIDTIIDRLVAEVDMLPEHEYRDEFAAFVISSVLSESALPKAPTNWFNLLLRFIEIRNSGKGRIADETRRFDAEFSKDSGITLHQFLFVIATTKKSTISDFEQLFQSLAGISAELRDDLLAAFQKQPMDMKLLVSNAWLGDHQVGSIDGLSAAARFKALAQTASSWNATTLAIECVVASSVMLDEYARDATAALTTLDEGQARYGPRLEFARQRAKVLFRTGEHEQSLDVIRRIGDVLDPSDYVERAFALRSAGVSAGELQRWDESTAFYEKARIEALKSEGDLASMAIGLLGDIAANATRSGNVKEALLRTKHALLELEQFEPPQTPVQIYTRHLIGHVPTWMDHYLGFASTPDYRDLPPGRCSQPEPIPAVLERPIYALDLLWYQLARVELGANEDAGILNAIRSWPDGRKLISYEFVLANEVLKRAIRQRDLRGFYEALPAEISACIYMQARAKDFKGEDLKTPSRGTFPILDAAAMQSEASLFLLMEATLAFAVSCILAGDIEAYSVLVSDRACSAPPGVQKVLAVLGKREQVCDDSRLILASYLARLSKGTEQLLPKDIFVIQCHLLDWLRNCLYRPPIVNAFADWVASVWTRIIQEERFRLRSPSVNVPLIESVLNDRNLAGLPKAATILLAVENALGPKLAPNFRKAIISLKDSAF